MKKLGSEFHGLTSPSNLARRLACPASQELEAQARLENPDTSTVHSERGTDLHRRMEVAILDNDMPDCDGLDDEDVEALDFCFSYFQSRTRGGFELCEVEFQVNLGDLGIPLTEDGCKIDNLLVFLKQSAYDKKFVEGTIVVTDWKFGRTFTSHPRKNLQLIAYGIGALNTIKTLFPDVEFWNIEVNIVQPSLNTPHRFHTFTEEELLAYVSVIQEITFVASKPNAPAIPGEECGFCAAKEGCAARRAVIKQRFLSPEAFWLTLDDDKKVSTYKQLIEAKKWCESFQEFIEKKILGGEVVPGFEIGKGSRVYSWKPDVDVEGKLTEYFDNKGLDPTQLKTAPALISKSAIEKIIGKSKPARDFLGSLQVSAEGKSKVILQD